MVATSLVVMTPIAAGAVTSSPSGTGNLLVGDKASFALSVGGWTGVNAQLSRVNSPNMNQTGALAVTTDRTGPVTAAAISGTGPGSWTTAAPGQIYTASAWALAGATGRPVQPILVFFSASGNQITSAWGQPTTDAATGWRQTSSVVGVAPAGTAYAELGLVIYGTSASESHLLDQPSLTATPSGSPSVVGPLHTRGSQIYDINNHPVVFRGINRYGLQAGSSIANLSADDIAHAKQWGANFIRIPLGEQSWLAGSCVYDATYRSKVDSIVNWVTSRGMVALLDLHFNTISSCGYAGQHVMADAPNSINFWSQVAARYEANPLVAFDLYNEPHDISDVVWRYGGNVTENGTSFDAAGMQQLYSAVRGQGASNLVFVSGNDWANRVPATAPLSGYNIVYGVHAYTCPETAPPACTTPNPYDPSSILGSWVVPSWYYPVMVTEFGWPDQNDGRYITNVVNYARSHGWGWDVFAWDGTTSGQFNLLADVGPGSSYEAKPTGMAVLTGLNANR